MSEKAAEFTFKVRFRPKQGWVDNVYLGNTLIEVLGAWQRSTGAFDFEVEALS